MNELGSYEERLLQKDVTISHTANERVKTTKEMEDCPLASSQLSLQRASGAAKSDAVIINEVRSLRKNCLHYAMCVCVLCIKVFC